METDRRARRIGVVIGWTNPGGTVLHAKAECGTSRRLLTSPTVVDISTTDIRACQRCTGGGFVEADATTVHAACTVQLTKYQRIGHPPHVATAAVDRIETFMLSELIQLAGRA